MSHQVARQAFLSVGPVSDQRIIHSGKRIGLCLFSSSSLRRIVRKRCYLVQSHILWEIVWDCRFISYQPSAVAGQTFPSTVHLWTSNSLVESCCDDADTACLFSIAQITKHCENFLSAPKNLLYLSSVACIFYTGNTSTEWAIRICSVADTAVYSSQRKSKLAIWAFHTWTLTSLLSFSAGGQEYWNF